MYEIFSACFRKKLHRIDDHHAFRHHSSHSIFDLICIGVGATLGSGVFVLTGLVARREAGPSVIISWLIAGVACLFSAMSYAELSSRMPSTGSSYTFVYHTLGEFPAYITAWCLTLECGVSGAAVARNWGVKLTTYFTVITDNTGNNTLATEIDQGINYFAGLLMLVTILIFLSGTEVSKFTINTFTILKICLVLFMVIGGLWLFQPKNLVTPAFLPFGVSGMFKGATSCFFGFVGYDEICCLALETDNPSFNLPVSVFSTIAIVTIFYLLTAIALVGMVPTESIDSDSGFSHAFADRHQYLASSITGIGELVTLPLVVIVSFLPQPRLCAALAEDGLLPAWFLYQDAQENLVVGILMSGFACLLIALFIPFHYLDDLISAGVLVALIFTNNALILYRCNDPYDLPFHLYRGGAHYYDWQPSSPISRSAAAASPLSTRRYAHRYCPEECCRLVSVSSGGTGYGTVGSGEEEEDSSTHHPVHGNNNNNKGEERRKEGSSNIVPMEIHSPHTNNTNNSIGEEGEDSAAERHRIRGESGAWYMQWTRCEIILFAFNLQCILSCTILSLLVTTTTTATTYSTTSAGVIIAVVGVLLLATAIYLHQQCPDITIPLANVYPTSTLHPFNSPRPNPLPPNTPPRSPPRSPLPMATTTPITPSFTFATPTGSTGSSNGTEEMVGSYRVAGVPYVPMLGILINYFLIGQLSGENTVVLLLFFLSTTILYVLFKAYAFYHPIT